MAKSEVISMKASPQLKKWLKEGAEREERTLSNFITHATLTYIKEHHKKDWWKFKAKGGD